MLYEEKIKIKASFNFSLLRNRDTGTELYGIGMCGKINPCLSFTGNMGIYAKHELISWLVLVQYLMLW